MTRPRALIPRPPAAPTSPRVLAAMSKLGPALAELSDTLVALGEPARRPFARLGAPPLDVLVALEPGAAAEAAIALVRASFHLGHCSGALTNAAKRVGNAALGVKRALAVEAARRARIAGMAA